MVMVVRESGFDVGVCEESPRDVQGPMNRHLIYSRKKEKATYAHAEK
jgi:hypothetical protein